MTQSADTTGSSLGASNIADPIERAIAQVNNSPQAFGSAIIVALLAEAKRQQESQPTQSTNMNWASNLHVTSDQDSTRYTISVDTPNGRIAYTTH